MTSSAAPSADRPDQPTRLPGEAYLDAIRRESARFRLVLGGADPDARVPACPDWDAADLLFHLAQVQAFWADVITHRPQPRDADAPRAARPDSYAGLLAHFDASCGALIDALAGADPADAAWSWAAHVTDGQTAGFTLRRQAHEALIHRLDAEDAAGLDRTPLDPALAADGVAELLEVMYGGAPPDWATFSPGPGPVRIDLSDVGVSLWTRPGILAGRPPKSDQAISVAHLVTVADPGAEPAAVITANAGDLDTRWWKRSAGAPTELLTSGAQSALDALSAALDPPLD